MSTTLAPTCKGKVHVPRSIEKRVEAGAAYLDDQHDGWFNEIDLDELDVYDTCRCVASQLSGCGSYIQGLNRLDLTVEQAISYGMDQETGDQLDPDLALATIAWRREIKRRRRAAQTKTVEAQVAAQAADPTDMSVSAVLWRAADIIVEDGWAQGAWCENGAKCAVGALEAAVGWMDRSAFHAALEAATNLLKRSVPGWTVISWNDEEDRTADQVIAKLREVALIEATR